PDHPDPKVQYTALFGGNGLDIDLSDAYLTGLRIGGKDPILDLTSSSVNVNLSRASFLVGLFGGTNFVANLSHAGFTILGVGGSLLGIDFTSSAVNLDLSAAVFQQMQAIGD